MRHSIPDTIYNNEKERWCGITSLGMIHDISVSWFNNLFIIIHSSIDPLCIQHALDLKHLYFSGAETEMVTKNKVNTLIAEAWHRQASKNYSIDHDG